MSNIDLSRSEKREKSWGILCECGKLLMSCNTLPSVVRYHSFNYTNQNEYNEYSRITPNSVVRLINNAPYFTKLSLIQIIDCSTMHNRNSFDFS